MDIIEKLGSNCRKNYTCSNNYECCSEPVPTGFPQFGMCVKRGYCDKKRGIPIKGSLKVENKSNVEQFDIQTREGYDNDDSCSCQNWTNAFMVLFIIIFLLLLLAVAIYLKLSHPR